MLLGVSFCEIAGWGRKLETAFSRAAASWRYQKKRKLLIWFGLINKTSLLCEKACGCAKVNKTLR